MQNVDERIDRLEQTVNELRNELHTLRLLVRTDFPSALNKIRFITEKVLSQLCKEHNIKWGDSEPTLENMIGPLIAAKVIPKPIAIHVRSVQTNTSPGSHFQESPLSAAHLDIAQMALVEFLEWYYQSHHKVAPGLGATDKPVQAAPHDPAKVPAVVAVALKPGQVRKPAGAHSMLLPGCMVMLSAALAAVLLMIGITAVYIYYKNHLPQVVQNGERQTTAPSGIPPAGSQAVADMCQQFETKVNGQLTARNYVGAISSVADYQVALLKFYPAPSFFNGHFHSEMYGLSFNAPLLASFTPQASPIEDSKEAAQQVGMDWILNVKGPTDSDHVGIISADWETLVRRMGQSEAGQGEKFLKLFGSQAVDELAQTQDMHTEQVRGMTVLRMTLQSLDRDMDVAAFALEHDGTCFTVLSVSQASQKSQNAERLESILGSLTFDGDPRVLAQVDDIKKQAEASKNPPRVLDSVRRIAMLGEYRRASVQLSTFVSLVAGAIPGPALSNNVVVDSSYGIKMKNPDPARWKVEIVPMGVMNLVLLNDSSSVSGGAIGYGTINPILNYGPKALELVGANVPDDALKDFFRGAGQGGLLNNGGRLESERFRQFRGLLCYEATGTTRRANVNEKILIVRQPECALMIFFLGSSSAISEYESLLDNCLEIRKLN